MSMDERDAEDEEDLHPSKYLSHIFCLMLRRSMSEGVASISRIIKQLLTEHILISDGKF